MTTTNWYETVGPEDGLVQGDLLLGTVHPLVHRFTASNNDVEVVLAEDDLVVLTQTCDLVNGKAPTVLLAVVTPFEQLVRFEFERGNQMVASKAFRERLVAGETPPFSLLRPSLPDLAWGVVDFRKLVTLDNSHVHDIARSKESRLRLLSPYREHLSQAFARFFMRVGLPHDAKEFVQEGEAIISAVKIGRTSGQP
jgi:hypothetical protein